MPPEYGELFGGEGILTVTVEDIEGAGFRKSTSYNHIFKAEF